MNTKDYFCMQKKVRRELVWWSPRNPFAHPRWTRSQAARREILSECAGTQVRYSKELWAEFMRSLPRVPHWLQCDAPFDWRYDLKKRGTPPQLDVPADACRRAKTWATIRAYRAHMHLPPAAGQNVDLI